MIQDKVVIITGASSGIGEATARLLARRGARVVLGARREAQLQHVTQEITQAGGQATYRVTDVTRPEDNAALVDLAKTAFGGLDVVFLNAGIMPTAPLSALNTAEWQQAVDINVMGVLHGIAAALPTFTAQQRGQVIATSSVAGLKSYPGAGVYGGTKWFVRNLMEVLRLESAQEGTNIRTATIYPAAINTELLGGITHGASAQAMGALYRQYGISPDRIAQVVAFAIDQPEDTNVTEFTVGPTPQPW
ncbi:SDR family oxidoreductase [Deinococcus radiotolerans]|uniref:Oxidoreductase n=1 Tax=Deinococcus radiotolerans TaxID=1309407 RepID=A0ABQ2FQQ7_9DEIO|nr:SDR family oxidoreductase [Deinococcus radiotolerans]GGL17665.1 oxidoreductase [Deinococcus radiotolerans]